MPKKIISVLSGKGGVGKSTFAVNVACVLAQSGLPTVLVDADIYNPCVFFHLDLAPRAAGLQELLDGTAKLEEVLPVHPQTGLRCISSSINHFRDVQIQNLPKLINDLDYEYVIIDCPPGLSPLIEETIVVSDRIFVMMTPDMPSCSAALKLSYMIEQRSEKRNAKPKVSYFLNRVAGLRYEVHPREVESLFKTKPIPILPEDEAVPESIASKVPVILSHPDGKFSSAVKKFAETLENEHDSAFERLAAGGKPETQAVAKPESAPTAGKPEHAKRVVREKKPFLAWLQKLVWSIFGKRKGL